MTPEAQQELTLAVAALLQQTKTSRRNKFFACEEVNPKAFTVWYKPERSYILCSQVGELLVSAHPISRNIWNAVMQTAKIPLEMRGRAGKHLIIATPWGDRTVNPRTWIPVTELLDPNYES